MKTFAGIIFLILLVCNVLGLSIAVLCLEYEYQTAQPGVNPNGKYILKAFVPSESISITWKDTGGVEGLYRINDQLYNIVRQVHENDTLYVTLQINESAWQHFTGLSEIMQEVYSNREVIHPFSHAIKLLNDLFKVYLPTKTFIIENERGMTEWFVRILYDDLSSGSTSAVLLPDSPPPENT